jgi:hypothetical protein
MARAQQQGINTVTVAMIVFVALWLTSTVFLVILYTNQEELRIENTQLLGRIRKTISDQEERSLELAKAATERTTVVGLIEEQRRQSAELATGTATDDATAIRSRRDQLVDRVRGESLVANTNAYVDLPLLDLSGRLYEELKSREGLYQESMKRVTELEDQLNRFLEAKGALESDFENRTKTMLDEFATLETERSQFRRTREDSVVQLERQFESRVGELQTRIDDARSQERTAQEQLGILTDRLEALRTKFADVLIEPEALATARQPDGMILTAVPGDEMVYINLGRDSRLTLGLQFTVYSRDTGIPADGRGKARIEVVSIGTDSAECRTVEVLGNEVILEGDLIANPIYDRSRAVNFLVLGEFDLDHDGIPDPDGVSRIEALISGWGGAVTGELTARTDFVVLGTSPVQPGPLASVTDPAEIQRLEGMRRAYERYHTTVEQARTLSIPILTQPVFMNFLGYAGQRFAAR